MHCYLLDIQHTPGSSVSLNRLAEYMYVAKLPCNTVTFALSHIYYKSENVFCSQQYAWMPV